MKRVSMIVAIGLAFGCGGDGDGEGGSGPAANCMARCGAVLDRCPQLANGLAADMACQLQCDQKPSEAQVQCAENKACDEVANGACDNVGADAGMSGAGGGGGGDCPERMCDCNNDGTPEFSGVITINGQCGTCEQACAQLGGGGVPDVPDIPGLP